MGGESGPSGGGGNTNRSGPPSRGRGATGRGTPAQAGVTSGRGNVNRSGPPSRGRGPTGTGTPAVGDLGGGFGVSATPSTGTVGGGERGLAPEPPPLAPTPAPEVRRPVVEEEEGVRVSRPDSPTALRRRRGGTLLTRVPLATTTRRTLLGQ